MLILNSGKAQEILDKKFPVVWDGWQDFISEETKCWISQIVFDHSPYNNVIGYQDVTNEFPEWCNT